MRAVVQQDSRKKIDSSETSTKKVINPATKLRILSRARRRKLPALIGCDCPEMMACAELIDSGELDGCVILGSDDQPQKISRAYITESGREYLEQFESETVSLFVLAHTRRLVRGFGFAAIFICLLVAFPKTNKSGERVSRATITPREHVDSSSDLNSSNPGRPQVILDTKNSNNARPMTHVRNESLKFVNGLCLRGSELD